jgi:hypothetical protein
MIASSRILVPTMASIPQEADVHGYAELPAAIKLLYTPKEWLWLGWEGRQHAIDRECMPDVAED